jgi:amidase
MRGMVCAALATVAMLPLLAPNDVSAQSPTADVSRETIVRQTLAEISAVDPKFRAIRATVPGVLGYAQNLDRSFGDESAGVLDRRTVAVKANIDLAALPASAGALRPGRPASFAHDARVVLRLKRAGALVVASTNTDTWARGTATVSEETGATGNAYDPTRSPLGSSGGSAVAVATGMVDMALGTDTCGSVRYPASANGIFGLRPSSKRVPTEGIVPLSPTQDVVGPMARNVDDLELLFTVIADTDESPGSSILRRRVGVMRGLGAVDRSVDGPIGHLRGAGFIIVELPFLDISPASVIDDEFEAARSIWRRGGDAFSEPLRVRDRRGYDQRLKSQARLRSRLEDVLEEYQLDVLVYPTTVALPGKRGTKSVTGNCWLSANSGLPALAVPGRVVNGFPTIGVDLLGRMSDESRLFAIARFAADPRQPV